MAYNFLLVINLQHVAKNILLPAFNYFSNEKITTLNIYLLLLTFSTTRHIHIPTLYIGINIDVFNKWKNNNSNVPSIYDVYNDLSHRYIYVYKKKTL